MQWMENAEVHKNSEAAPLKSVRDNSHIGLINLLNCSVSVPMKRNFPQVTYECFPWINVTGYSAAETTTTADAVTERLCFACSFRKSSCTMNKPLSVIPPQVYAQVLSVLGKHQFCFKILADDRSLGSLKICVVVGVTRT